jgi:hypothetical protein
MISQPQRRICWLESLDLPPGAAQQGRRDSWPGVQCRLGGLDRTRAPIKTSDWVRVLNQGVKA